MTRTILRGRVFTFIEEPQGIDDTASYRYLEDGAVTVENGKIIAVRDYSPADAAGAEVIDHRPSLIMPGFIDLHLHYVQMQVIGSYAPALLDIVLDRFSSPTTRTTVLQDWMKGRRAEIQEINGTVVRAMRSAGLRAPANERTVEIAQTLERDLRSLVQVLGARHSRLFGHHAQLLEREDELLALPLFARQFDAHFSERLSVGIEPFDGEDLANRVIEPRAQVAATGELRQKRRPVVLTTAA